MPSPYNIKDSRFSESCDSFSQVVESEDGLRTQQYTRLRQENPKIYLESLIIPDIKTQLKN